MKKFTLSLALLIATSFSFAQKATVYSSNFNDSTASAVWGFYNPDEDGCGWAIVPDTYGVNGSGALVINYALPGEDSAMNDAAITPDMQLSAGVTYELSFIMRELADPSYKENLEVDIYSVDTILNYANVITEFKDYTDTNYTKHTRTFTVPANGLYYIAFYGFSEFDQGGIIIDDFAVEYNNSAIADTKEPKIAMFPNPTKGYLNITNAAGANVEIRDILGNVVANKTMEATSKSSIDLSNLPNGVYMVKIAKDNKVISKKINIIR